MLSACGRAERGSALLSVIGMSVFGALIVIAIMVSTQASNDTSKNAVDSSFEGRIASDAGVVLASAYSSLRVGEHVGYVPDAPTLRDYARIVNGNVRANGQLPIRKLRRVDTDRVPDYGRFATWKPLGDDRLGWWQVYSVKLPTWQTPSGGTTTVGGRVVVYVRTWITGPDHGQLIGSPRIYRLDLRPTWFSDFQELVDGPTRIGADATIEGRIHSNGFESSYYDQYRSQVDRNTMIEVDASVGCGNTVTITTANGNLTGSPSCRGRWRLDAGRRYNLLRIRELVERVRDIDRSGGHPNLNVRVVNSPDSTTRVELRSNGLAVNGGPLISARVSDSLGIPGRSEQGAVLLVHGNVELSGTLGSQSRALVIAAAEPGATRYGRGSAPSIWVVDDEVGAAPTNGANVGSSFGAVAEGNVVFDQTRACGVTYRGSILAMSGGVSSHPTWHVPYTVANPRLCRGRATIQGSVSAHFATNLYGVVEGYTERRYSWYRPLFDNPPPLSPTAGDWEVSSVHVANLDCFDAQSGALEITLERCR